MARPVISDELWRRIEPLLPRPKVRNRHRQCVGRAPADSKQALAGIIFALRTGIPWEHVPATEQWPSGYTCLRRLKVWHRRGVFRRLLVSILSELSQRDRLSWRRAIVDSASVRAPHGGRAAGPNPTDRRKTGTKHHVLVEAHGIPLVVTMTGANRHDVTELLRLVDSIPKVQGKRGRPRSRPEFVQGDRAYDSQPHREALAKRGAKVSSPSVGRRTAQNSDVIAG